MKKLFLILALLMALVFNGCSKNKDKDDKKSVNENPETQTTEENKDTKDVTQDDKQKDDENSDSKYSEKLTQGEYMVELKLSDLDGNEVMLDELVEDGKILFVNFWSSTWHYCVNELEDLVKINERDDVKVVMVNLNDSKDTIKSLFEEKGIDLPVYIEPENATIKITDKFPISGIPASYFFSDEGKFLGNVEGAIGYDGFNSYIDGLK